jgi:Zn-dependent protease with chaperone function
MGVGIEDVKPSFGAKYFDGQSSRPHDVTASVDGASIELRGATIERTFVIREARVSERLAHAPRLITFGDGSYCEVADHEALDAALAATGFRDSLVVKWQSRWRYAVVALVATVGVLALGYLYVLPWGARIVADQIPLELEAGIGREAVAWMERNMFAPTQLPEDRRAAIVERFAQIAPEDAREYRIEFRRSRIGPNALAFPGGLIVMTDELVALAPGDDAVLGVLAHELGHMQNRHLLRRLITSTVTGAVATLLAGDASGIATALPATLADLSYSRDMEREADDYAIERMRAAGLSVAPLADLLEKMEGVRARSKAGGEGARLEGYLSTHPDTAERVRKLRKDAAGPS